MRTITNWRVRSEPYAWQRQAGRYNPGRQLIIKEKGYRRIVPIGAGSSDDVEVFRDGDLYYVVSMNAAYDYAGLETFPADPLAHQAGGEIFLQADHEIREILGPRGLQLTPRTIARRLAEYLD